MGLMLAAVLVILIHLSPSTFQRSTSRTFASVPIYLKVEVQTIGDVLQRGRFKTSGRYEDVSLCSQSVIASHPIMDMTKSAADNVEILVGQCLGKLTY
jgi:hypothetical protein